MKLGPDLIIACPHCGFLARKRTILSGNTFGAKLWSDGKLKARMWLDLPKVTKCSSCKHFYWIDEVEVKGEIDLFDNKTKNIPQEWENAQPIMYLTIDEYIEVLETDVPNDVQKERYLRKQFWWSVNDILRENLNAQIPTYYLQKLHENLAKLTLLLDEYNPNDRIIKAEIARETGDFKEAIRLLEGVPENYSWVVNKIMELAKNENSLVTQLQRDS